MPGLRYATDYIALRKAVDVVRSLPYDPAGNWSIVAKDRATGTVTDANGFIRASFHHSNSFTPEILLDLVLQACHTHISTGKSPYLARLRPPAIVFLSTTSVPDSSIQIFADLLAELHVGIAVAPVWEEDLRAIESEVRGRVDAGWWASADAEEEANWRGEIADRNLARMEEKGLFTWLWTILLLIPLVSLLASRLKLQGRQQTNSITSHPHNT
ncbi:hypothetical protein DFS34DRAFT_600185 [Phlyctochytrium arcticum]|nr:hypothetical protein DFS34DRAFT_600185 [Phlyctochytrium arcticum]